MNIEYCHMPCAISQYAWPMPILPYIYIYILYYFIIIYIYILIIMRPYAICHMPHNVIVICHVIWHMTYDICHRLRHSHSYDFWKLRCGKSACWCGAKHIWKWKVSKHIRFGPLLEVVMWKKCTPLWCEADTFWVTWVNMLKLPPTFGPLWEVVMWKKVYIVKMIKFPHVMSCSGHLCRSSRSSHHYQHHYY